MSWTSLLRTRVWTHELYRAGAVPCWVMAGQVFARLVSPFRKLILAVGGLVDEDVSDHGKEALAEEIRDACDHVDAFIRDYKSHAPTKEAILSPRNLEYTQDVLSNTPISNIISESSFASSHQRRHSSHGNCPAAETYAANHVLRKSQTVLDLFVRERDKGAIDIEGLLPRPVKTPYRNFFRKRRQAGKTATEVAEEWREMSEIAKEAFRPKHRPLPNVPEESGPKRRPWPFIGDDDYPVDAEHMTNLPDHVREARQAWTARVGNVTIGPGPDFEAPPVRLCEDLWGRGRCGDVLPPNIKTTMMAWRTRFDRWSKICRSPVSAYNEDWRNITFVYFGSLHDAAGSADDDRRGIAALVLYETTTEQVFYAERCLPPRVNDVISFTPHPDNFRSAVDLAWDLAQLSIRHDACLLTYTWVGLSDFLVVGLQDLGDFEMACAVREAKRRQEAHLCKVISTIDQTRKRKKSTSRTTKRLRTKCPPKTACDARSEEEADDDADASGAPPAFAHEGDAGALAALDAEIQQEIAAEESEDERELRAAEADIEREVAAMHADGGGAGPEDEENGSDEGDDGPLPRIDSLGYVHNPHNDDETWGRVTVLRPGARDESLSLYCSRHGCKVMMLMHSAPSTTIIKRWFKCGQALPRGRTAALVARHKEQLRRLRAT